MTTQIENQNRIEQWLLDCTGYISISQLTIQNIKNSAGREVWGCSFSTAGTLHLVVLSIFKQCSFDLVNTSLPPHAAVEKCYLAMEELRALGVPTPNVLGRAKASQGKDAALLCERVNSFEWNSQNRIEAARVLSILHRMQADELSPRLQELTRISDPRMYRTTEGKSPESGLWTLVHGDYFSKNILPVGDGIRVIDWETFGWGDPMWDLGFLIGADPDLGEEIILAVITEYQKIAPVNLDCLVWHQEKWRQWWEHWRANKVG